MLICARFVTVNKYWDRASKILVCIIDAGLNWYFLRIVQERLVKESRLTKYRPLVSFNAKLMILSVGMDVCLHNSFSGTATNICD
jgi:hypothetical protein